MNETNPAKKKKIVWQQYIAIILYIFIGVACGVIMSRYSDKYFEADMPFYEEILLLVGQVLGIYVAIFIQLIIHEVGHLVFGLFSGYKFSSLRIFNFMWVKENEKIKLKRLTIAGTGGQCLMSPPEIEDGKLPVVLYNLGGSLMNMITGLIFLGLFFGFQTMPLFSTMTLILAVIGFMLALMNGIPMRMGMVDNDGYNAFALTRNSAALQAFWVQMKVNEQIAKGIRIKDMPDEWFRIPSDEAMKNSMIVVIGVFACNRLMDAQRFEEADKLMEHMLEIDSGMVDLHRNLMICDRMYCELIGANRCKVLEDMLTKEQKKFMKQMKNFPSVLRTEYVYALLYEKDTAKADKFKTQFEKCAKSYPYENDVQSERELMEIAERKELA